ncbi:hypothetical protein BBF96_04540 [Anoxybacter fermentans]|uniref:NADH dehydrogenase n=1 Tax=Anoxybacter fermentans TaxID=1323375 RepID=A0A3S9SWV0_9FIRM|nr:(2Fe-2S) ferredoxin domain-containing protein [Anoxybacter fermentans]AZR72722.1 hypothetical protein BBF96_04540 [Anoxybacter fermentans]
MKSIEELQKIKDQVLEEIKLRDNDSNSIQVEVGMGTCGIAAGAREVMQAILDELNKRKVTGVKVVQTGCIGLCAEEPLVIVKQPNKGTVIYGNLDPNKARQIVAQHLVNGLIIEEWVVNE